MAKTKLTPLMEQYMRIREQYPDTLLFFQVGDFYELFFEDAKEASSFLAIALTKRGKCNGQDVPLCGVPRHAYRHYVAKLVKGGYRVAICDQLGEPKPGTVVERAVTQVITPSTVTDPTMLDNQSASYLLTFAPTDDRWGLVFGEILTAQLYATTVAAGNFRGLESELARFFPDEIVVANGMRDEFEHYFKKMGFLVSTLGEDVVGKEQSCAWIAAQFGQEVAQKLTQAAALESGMQLFHHYLSRTQQNALSEFSTVRFYDADHYLLLDRHTQHNLELVKNAQDGSRSNTLLATMDRARTAMGSRTIKKWLVRPLVQQKAIIARQEVVGAISGNVTLLSQLEELLGHISDVERIVGRIALGKALLNDYLALKNSLAYIAPIKQLLCQHSNLSLVQTLVSKLTDFAPLIKLLTSSIHDEGNSTQLIKREFDERLDAMRQVLEQGADKIRELESRERSATGIGSLKITYNKVSGYALEVTKTNLALVPEHYTRCQTLSNRERYMTDELVCLERDITRATNEVGAREEEVFEQVKQDVYSYLSSLRNAAAALACLDGLYSFARIAYDNNYVRPIFHDSHDILIEDGRHPVVEKKLSSPFTPNSTSLTEEQSLWVITGPNMGGKSTYLRQVALISIMAQCGSFVPAQQAQLPILDRIFTRIGAGDNVSEGKSTFFVEMEETATIVKEATKHSLVILDEVGRGTSTYDGLAIAQAVIEHIQASIGARCLFATHYHELTRLADQRSGIANYHVLCEQAADGTILFLHTLAPGISGQSFGLAVARLAQLPSAIVDRAKVLQQSYSGQSTALRLPVSNEQPTSSLDAQRLARYEELASQLQNLDFDELSPRQAYDLLWSLVHDKLKKV